MLHINERSGGRGNLAESAWLSPLQELDEMDAAEFENGPDLLFAGSCLVYCDLFTVSEERTATRARVLIHMVWMRAGLVLW